MTLPLKITLFFVTLISLEGCAKNRSTSSNRDSISFKSVGSSIWNSFSVSANDEDIWEQGYGFNNPNADRIKAELRQ